MRRALGALLGALLLLSGTLAHAQAAGTFTLSWTFTQDAQNPALGYLVQRCIQLSTGCAMSDLSGQTQIPLTTLSVVDAQVSANIQYCYRVSGYNSFGRGPYSSPVCGLLGAPPSTAPANVLLRLTLPATP